MFKETEDLN